MEKAEKILNKILGNITNNKYVFDGSKLYINSKYVTIDNFRSSCSTLDLFHINTEHIKSISNFKDIDGFYKISILFDDEKELIFIYHSQQEMNIDYERLISGNGNTSVVDLDDSETSDDSESSDTPVEPQTKTIYFILVGLDVTPQYPYTNKQYSLYATENEHPQFEEGEVQVLVDVKEIPVEKRYLYVNFFYNVIEDRDNPNLNYCDFYDDYVSVFDTDDEADADHISGYYKKTTLIDLTNRHSTPVTQL